MASEASNAGPIHAELALTELIAKTHLPVPDFQKLYRELAEKSLVRPRAKVAECDPQ